MAQIRCRPFFIRSLFPLLLDNVKDVLAAVDSDGYYTESRSLNLHTYKIYHSRCGATCLTKDVLNLCNLVLFYRGSK